MFKIGTIEFVILQGVHPEQALKVSRQVEACHRAGIGATMQETWDAWLRVNRPLEKRAAVVGKGHPWRDPEDCDEEE